MDRFGAAAVGRYRGAGWRGVAAALCLTTSGHALAQTTAQPPAPISVQASAATPVPNPVQSSVAAPQVLTLDQDRLYAESLYGKALEARITATNQTLAAENRKIEQDLSAEEADLTQRRPTMSALAFQALADAFDAKVERLRTDQAAKVEAVKTGREAGRKQFFQAAVPILADLMRQSGAYAILNRSAVVLAFDSIDLTDRAIAALDATLGNGSAATLGPRLPVPADPSGPVPGTPTP